MDDEAVSIWMLDEDADDGGRRGDRAGDWTWDGGGGVVVVVECGGCGVMCDGEIMLLILWSVDRLGGDEKSTLGARIVLVSVVNNGCCCCCGSLGV